MSYSITKVALSNGQNLFLTFLSLNSHQNISEQNTDCMQNCTCSVCKNPTYPKFPNFFRPNCSKTFNTQTRTSILETLPNPDTVKHLPSSFMQHRSHGTTNQTSTCCVCKLMAGKSNTDNSSVSKPACWRKRERSLRCLVANKHAIEKDIGCVVVLIERSYATDKDTKHRAVTYDINPLNGAQLQSLILRIQSHIDHGTRLCWEDVVCWHEGNALLQPRLETETHVINP